MKKTLLKLSGVAAAVVFAFGAITPVSAQSIAELQALIAQLQAQLAALSGGQTTTPTFNYTRDLTIGSTGSDVVALQSFLESKGRLVMPGGVAKGYFGPITRTALAQYQANHMITPAVGYFGPITRAKVMAEGAITTPGTGTPTTPGTGLSGGEASLESYTLDSENDVEEGKMDLVAVAEFDVEDGDVRINRMDVTFNFVGDAAQADDEPWDAFETITLMIDGKEIAEMDIDDEDDWLRDKSPFVVRLSNLDYVVDEGETVEIEIWLTAQNNVDGADSGDATWEIYVDNQGVRAVDSEGIQNYIGNTNEKVTFDIEEAGAGEGIEIMRSSNDPDASLLLVDTDDRSKWHEIFVFELEAEENDIDLEELVLLIRTGTANYNSVVNDVVIEIDGEEFDDFSLANGNTTEATLTFDIDGDFTIDADESVDVVVLVEFKKQVGNYVDKTETIRVQTVSVKGEGVDDVSDTSTVSSKTHTLSLSTADIGAYKWEVPSTGNFLDFYFTVEAEEDDFEVLEASIVDSITGTATVSDPVLTRQTGDAEAIMGGFEVLEGESATFRIRYSITGANGTWAEATITSIAGESVPNDKQKSPTATRNIQS